MTQSDTTETDGIEHTHEHGEMLVKVDSSKWRIVNRLVDVDANTKVYRLREADTANAVTEFVTESQLSRRFDVNKEEADR